MAQIIPLTKQLTNISGNLWSRTLKGARAERIEYLLLHEFHNLKYVTPERAPYQEKGKAKAKAAAGEEGDVEDDDKPTRRGRQKPTYAGGLVLEPKRGLYDSYILLLDFNSLYPSIIQEYNLCFTTINWPTFRAATAPAAAAAGTPATSVSDLGTSLVT